MRIQTTLSRKEKFARIMLCTGNYGLVLVCCVKRPLGIITPDGVLHRLLCAKQRYGDKTFYMLCLLVFSATFARKG